MNAVNQAQLNALMLKFAKVGEHEDNSINFLKEWRPFFQTLTDSEKKVAIKAYPSV